VTRADPLQLVIIGAGGHGSELYSYVQDLRAAGDDIRLLGFVDEVRPPGRWGEAEILGNFDDLRAILLRHREETVHYITAIGDNRARQEFVRKAESLRAPNLSAWTLRHPTATVGADVAIGPGTCLAPGAIVTTRVTIGSHCILNVKASVSHDCVIADFVNINPGAVLAGAVRVGRASFVGAGATVIQGISIGEDTIVGAGAVVVGDLPARVTAVGVPARIIKHHSPDGERP
jgi:sugar O-acyltransferase (sialic acid O-acetyltransferase NeuD family)